MNRSAKNEANCVFCKIVNQEIPAEIVHKSKEVLAFKDLSPQAPVHVLVIPKQHHENVVEVAENPQLLAEIVKTGSEIASKLADSEFRLIFNTGKQAGQTVFHAHGHVLAGQKQAEGSLA